MVSAFWGHAGKAAASATVARNVVRIKFANQGIPPRFLVALKSFTRSHLIIGMASDLDMASGTKALVFMSLNVAAEAATHKDDS